VGLNPLRAGNNTKFHDLTVNPNDSDLSWHEQQKVSVIISLEYYSSSIFTSALIISKFSFRFGESPDGQLLSPVLSFLENDFTKEASVITNQSPFPVEEPKLSEAEVVQGEHIKPISKIEGLPILASGKVISVVC
jgi:hypothetical protein